MSEKDKEDPIGKALGLEPIFESHTEVIDQLLTDGHDDSAMKDFEKARANIHDLIDAGEEAIFKLAELAESSQQPRAYEVLAKLIDTTLNANKTLLEMQEKIRSIKHADAPTDKAKNVTNNLFVGSTAELQKMLKDIKKTDG